MNRESCRANVKDGDERFTPAQSSPYQRIISLLDQLDPDQLDALGARVEKKRLARFAPAESEQLTDREKEVLVLVASGYNRKEIGRSLDISACTAAKHISNIYRKLGVSTIAEATRVALVENIS
jgi:DNA-binding CsgD family transcriptional regulator